LRSPAGSTTSPHAVHERMIEAQRVADLMDHGGEAELARLKFQV
jgi:hypothetical protein